VQIPYTIENAEHSYHQYTIICDNREKIIDELAKNKIGYGIYYPKPLHYYDHLKKYAHKDLKNSEDLAQKVISYYHLVTKKIIIFILKN
jgi:dTDP-4-amino-4,6-dideoxygalactose transaminase